MIWLNVSRDISPIISKTKYFRKYVYLNGSNMAELREEKMRYSVTLYNWNKLRKPRFRRGMENLVKIIKIPERISVMLSTIYNICTI